MQRICELPLIYLQTDHRSVVLDPLDDFWALPVLVHELCNGMSCLGDALALGQLGVDQHVEGSHTDLQIASFTS